MIKNIIFDLGNVLISFKPAEFLESMNFSENIRNTILNDIFRSREWAMLDNGDITTNEAINAISSKSSLKKSEIKRIFNLRKELMFPLNENVKMLPELSKRGFQLYYLSNFPSDIFEEVKSGYKFFRYFKGGCISSEVKLSKPNVMIYSKLLEKYSLKPEESLFLDDTEMNVHAAESLGMKGFCTNGSLDLYHQIDMVLERFLV